MHYYYSDKSTNSTYNVTGSMVGVVSGTVSDKSIVNFSATGEAGSGQRGGTEAEDANPSSESSNETTSDNPHEITSNSSHEPSSNSYHETASNSSHEITSDSSYEITSDNSDDSDELSSKKYNHFRVGRAG